MHVLLFDIDGTLIRSGGAGKHALESAFADLFGVNEVRDGVPYAGRTDIAIMRDLLALHDLEAGEQNVMRLMEAYLERLPQSLASNRGVVLPGVVELLGQLGKRADISVGLLTGNVRRGAERKLTHFGLWQHFAFGGFGDASHDRDEVARAALRDTERHLGKAVSTDRVWVIGDTPLDVRCARAIGAKAMGVCTGWHCRAELEESRADVVVDDLSDAASLLGRWI